MFQLPSIAPLLLACALGSPVDGPFRDLTFDEALTAAEREEKVVLVDFFTTWCAPCKKLDRTTWVDEGVVKWLGENTVAIRLDAEIETSVAERYDLRAYPTLLFVEAQGTERGRIVGYCDAKEFLERPPRDWPAGVSWRRSRSGSSAGKPTSDCGWREVES